LVLQRILKTASDRIKNNYIQNPFSSEVYYKSDSFVDDSLLTSKEHLVNIYDAEAYKRTSVEETYKAINFRIEQSRTHGVGKSLADASSLMDDILSFDLVRNTRNILDKHNLLSYDLAELGEMSFEGDSIVAISYAAKSDALDVIGQTGVKKYTGVIYINKLNYAVVKNELNVELNNLSTLGKSLITEASKNENIIMKIVSSYAKLDNHYYLRAISYEIANGNKDLKTQLITVKINSSNPELIDSRDYYISKEYNKNFWDKFSLVFEGEE
jgi:hypothetical protein